MTADSYEKDTHHKIHREQGSAARTDSTNKLCLRRK